MIEFTIAVSRTPTDVPEELLAEATKIVREDGPAGLTMEALAERSGLSRATVYRRTGGREALVAALDARGVDAKAGTDARGRILAAARTVFAKAGFESATIEEIAAEASLGAATIYRCFGDKDSLVAAFLDELGPRRAARGALAAASDDPRADLERFAERMLTALRDDQPVVRLVLIEALRGGPWIARVRALSPTRTLTTLSTMLEAHVRAGRLEPADPKVLATSFVGALMGFGLFAPVLHGTAVPDPKTTAQVVTSLFLQGASAPERSPREAPPRRARRDAR